MEHEVNTSVAPFASRSFDIESWGVAPEITFRPDRKWQLTVRPRLAEKSESVGQTAVRSAIIPFSVRYGSLASVSIRGSVEHSNIRLSGPARGLQEYQLTEGRGAGSAWLWQVSINARLTDVLTATAGYDGRDPSSGKTIHTGRIQFAAKF